MMLYEGHSETALNVFSFLKLKSNPRLIFDPMAPKVGKSNLVECDWHEFYAGATKVIPPNAPKLLGKSVTPWMFIGNDHTGRGVNPKFYCLLSWSGLHPYSKVGSKSIFNLGNTMQQWERCPSMQLKTVIIELTLAALISSTRSQF